MKTSIRNLFVLVFLTFVFAGFLPVQSLAHHSWDGYRWSHTTVPFAVRLGDNVSGEWRPYFFGAAYYWDRSSVLDIPVIPGSSAPATCNKRGGTVQVCNAAYGTTGWLGLTQLSVTGKIITQANIKLNDTYFSQSRFNNPGWKNLVVCQEVGHALGLTHQDENFGNPPLGSCMDYSNDPNPNQHPNHHDYVQLQSIYSRVDAASDAVLADDMAAADYSNQGEWGNLVRGSERGKTDASLASSTNWYAVYERDLGAGKKIQTVVLWVQ